MLSRLRAKRFHRVTNITRNYAKKSKLKPQTRILLVGGLGQIGSELYNVFSEKYGKENVFTSDVRASTIDNPNFKYVDTANINQMEKVVVEKRITWLVHLASVLSATGEKNHRVAIDVNIRGIENALEVARKHNLRIFSPSSIAAFGPTTPMDNTPNLTTMRPTTIYGVSKVYIELLGEYYNHKFGVDFRSIRYPGIISSETLPGGGTTDYAIDIFHKAVKQNEYTCFLRDDRRLPMMYIPDCLKATVQLIEADRKSLKSCTYNISAVDFTPAEIAHELRKHLPDGENFKMNYQPDFRDDIAASWPSSLDDSDARRDWGWQHEYDLAKMTKDMYEKIKRQIEEDEEDEEDDE
eukprot:TRINITY_DN8355_c0_g1_i1.p1 TRINITY_DN8355_c0_g1~~TRINITY_DN8355_c0_g1_i1.p1  ORF type:complete len:352 (+),score=90.52 TRINITY_DN8355_c0_g1_i1:238-1293(+)